MGPVVEAALAGEPQEIHLAIKKPVVALSRQDFARLTGSGPNAWECLKGLPHTDALAALLEQIEED